MIPFSPYQFPEVCDYQDAFYSVLVRDETEDIVVTMTRSFVYDNYNYGPDSIGVVLETGMRRAREYTAFINVTTAAGDTIKDYHFSELQKFDENPTYSVTKNNFQIHILKVFQVSMYSVD